MATLRSSTAGAPRARPLFLLLLAAILGSLAPARLWAQATTPADSAAILLHAADELARAGRGDASAALLDYIRTHYGATAAGLEAGRRLAGLPAPRPGTAGAAARSTGGRTELTVWGTTYGIWTGTTLPIAFGAEGPGAIGAGLLVGGPVGYIASRAYARATDVTEGEARAITFGGTWGNWQGYGWGKLAGWLERQNCFEGSQPGGTQTFCSNETSGRAVLKAMLLGGAAGIVGGAVLGNNLEVTPGAATTVNLAALWGTGYGLGTALLAGKDNGNGPLAFALLGGDAALVGSALAWPAWRLSRERARLISIAGLAGALAGVGADLVFKVEDRPAAGIAMAGGLVGLALGASSTRAMPAETALNGREGAPGGPGALLRLDRGRLDLAMPAPTPVLLHGGAAAQGVAPAVLVPVFSARF